MTYQIDHDIPIPAAGQPCDPKYPFADMAVGDSFFVGSGNVIEITTATGRYGIRHGKRFTVRLDFDLKANPGVRVWRIS